MNLQPKDRFSPLDNMTIEKLRAVQEIIEAFRAVDPAVPFAYIAGFLAVAIQPGGGANFIGRVPPRGVGGR